MKNFVLYYNIEMLKTPTFFDPCGINIREPIHQMMMYNTSKKALNALYTINSCTDSPMMIPQGIDPCTSF